MFCMDASLKVTEFAIQAFKSAEKPKNLNLLIQNPSFNPQPAAQADRCPADLFERCRAQNVGTDQTRNDISVDVKAAAEPASLSRRG